MKQAAGIPRRWIAIFLALLLTAVLLDAIVFWKKPAAANRSASAAQAAAPSEASVQTDTVSAAEQARRAAIAALGPMKSKGINAADLYKQASALFAQLTDEEKTQFRHPRKDLDAAGAAALYAKIQAIMDLLRKARKADYMDWGTGPMRLDSDLMPRVTMEQDLSAMALWESSYRFQSDPDGAVGDLAALEAMGRNDIDSLLGLVLQDANHAKIVNVLAQNAGALDAGASSDLSDIVSPAGMTQSYQAGLTQEVALQQTMLDEYNDPATRNGSLLQKALANNPDQHLASDLQWTGQLENTLATTLTEPATQFDPWWAQQISQAASNPIASQLLPSLASVRAATQVSMVQNVMLQAGLALEQNDQSGFQAIVDPITGQPFTYTQTPGGFQLNSSFQRNGQPVTLNFTTPAK